MNEWVCIGEDMFSNDFGVLNRQNTEWAVIRFRVATEASRVWKILKIAGRMRPNIALSASCSHWTENSSKSQRFSITGKQDIALTEIKLLQWLCD